MIASLTTGHCADILNELVGMRAFGLSFIERCVKDGELVRDTPLRGIRPEEMRRFVVNEFVVGAKFPPRADEPLWALVNGVATPEIEALFYPTGKRQARPRSSSGKLLTPEQEKRIRARVKANRHVRFGRIQRQPCEVCGYLKAEKHHSDYDQPLLIRWLCRKHHMELHRKVVTA